MPGENDDRSTEAVEVETSDVTAEAEKAWPPSLEVKHAGFESGDDVECKDASGDIAVNIQETEDPYVFDLVGGVTGVIDRVQDVVEPGAYTKTLKVRTPKIIKDHEWSQRLGKVLSIKELKPGDAGLPETVADGSPWPKEAGALVAKVRLFKKSQAGQEAAERWREYGRDQQFSIGYRVPAGMAVKSKDGVRHIKELDLYEISDVLWGAAPDSTLLPSVLSTKVLHGVELESKGDDPEDDEEAVEVEESESSETDGTEPQETNTGSEIQAEETDESDDDGESDDTEPPVTHEPFDDDEVDFDIEEVDFDSDDIDAEAFDAFGDEVASTVRSDIAREATPEGAAPSTSDAGEHTADTLTDVDPGPGDAPDNAAAVDAVVDGNNGPVGDEPETAAPSTGDDVAGVAEKALGAIESHIELREALRVYEASSESEKAAYGPYIAKSAHAAGIDFLLPEDLAAIDIKTVDIESSTDEPDDLDSKYNIAPLGTGNNYVTQEGGLDPFIRAVAHSLIESGHDKSRAIALAIGSMKRWARGGGNVTPKTRAKAVKALASWEALKARAKARPNKKSDDVEVERQEATGSAERKSMMVPFFAGSQEEIRALVCAALNESAELGQFEGRPQVIGTFTDYVIITVWATDAFGASDVDTGYSTYKVDFDYDPDAGTVELGNVQPIRITSKTTNTDTSGEEVPDILANLDDESSNGADSVKHAVTMLDLENKAGRVLSAANAEALKSAYESLGALLAKAGVDVETPDDTTNDAVMDESDVDEKTDEHTETKTVEVAVEDTQAWSETEDQIKQLQLMQLLSEVRARTLNLDNGSLK